ncbi:MAG: AAA family ATPase [Rhodopseudomonas sp.]|nr:AAA family ATPase [Rhodopseudomonas sp.]
MNVIVFASRKGGTGKSTLAAHLASCCVKSMRDSAPRSCLLIDADPQGSLRLWHSLRKGAAVPLQDGSPGLDEIIETARRDGVEWVLIDTAPMAPTLSGTVAQAIAAATLVVIPTRPAVFDLNAVTETVAATLAANRPFAVVLNAVPPKRLGVESAMATNARRSIAALGAPVWSGQITNRASLALSLADGAGSDDVGFDHRAAADEMASLWTAIENSVAAIKGIYAGVAMHQQAA